MLNNKAFILYDTLIAFMILTSVILLFSNAIEIDYKLLIESKKTIEVISVLREGILNDKQSLNKNGVKTSVESGRYCATKDDIKKCITL